MCVCVQAKDVDDGVELEEKSHTLDVQSVKSQEQEVTSQPAVSPAAPVSDTNISAPANQSIDQEAEAEVSLDFESFLHNNGTLYSCFNHHGNRVYVDETQVRMWTAPCDGRSRRSGTFRPSLPEPAALPQ